MPSTVILVQKLSFAKSKLNKKASSSQTLKNRVAVNPYDNTGNEALVVYVPASRNEIHLALPDPRLQLLQTLACCPSVTAPGTAAQSGVRPVIIQLGSGLKNGINVEVTASLPVLRSKLDTVGQGVCANKAGAAINEAASQKIIFFMDVILVQHNIKIIVNK